MSSIEPVTLEGDFVRLEPLSRGHEDGLRQAIEDGELWKLLVTLVPHPNDIRRFLNNAEEAYAEGDGLAFATIDRESSKIAGSTRFMHTEPSNKRTEIGFTFLGKSWQRTSINTEAKLLMLTHAFEHLGYERVGFITDYFNTGSQRAIERIGAKREGVLRNHMIMRDDRIRDSVVYSIIKSEWPGVKLHLNELLESHR